MKKVFEIISLSIRTAGSLCTIYMALSPILPEKASPYSWILTNIPYGKYLVATSILLLMLLLWSLYLTYKNSKLKEERLNLRGKNEDLNRKVIKWRNIAKNLKDQQRSYFIDKLDKKK